MASSSSSSTAATCPIKKSRKRELKKIENETSREVTFSKRRKGLFGKAMELSVLCGAEIAIVAYSPHGNPFVLGTGTAPTSADDTLGRFAAGIVPSPGEGAPLIDWSSLPLLDENRGLRRQQQGRGRGRGLGRCWWEDPVEDGLDENGLENYIDRAEKLREKATQRLVELRSSPIPATSTTYSADRPNSEVTVVNCCTEAGMQLVFGESAVAVLLMSGNSNGPIPISMG